MSPFQSIRRTVTNLPIPWKLSLIMGLFSVVVFALLTLSICGMEILSGSRAYVFGEGIWSKSEKEAVYHLSRYNATHDEADYLNYVAQISIPLGDSRARVEMGKPDMNVLTATQGFIEGRNHPADLPTQIWMGHKLRNFRYMNKVLDIWGRGDALIQELLPLADALHREIASGHPLPERVRALLSQVQAIDTQLTPLEDEFSSTLGEWARWLKTVLFAVMIFATGISLAFSLMIAFIISKHLCDEIDHLRIGATRVALGDYSFSLTVDSKDEIGDLSRTFQQMAAQRKEAERVKDEFFANVSHELRTPLTLILSPLESLLSEAWALDPAIKPPLQTMHNNTVRLLQLVNSLLDFSKLDAGKVSVHREPVRIRDLTEMIYRDFQPMTKEKKVEILLEKDLPKETAVMMDRYLYERIFFNLLSNAVKFTPPGGRITVRLAWSEGRLILSVADTGIGIPPEELAQIFQRFHQVEGSFTRHFEGTGLGLALAQEFAALLGGKVSVKSTSGKGSTFTLTCLAAPAVEGTMVDVEALRTPAPLRAPLYPLMVTAPPPTNFDPSQASPKVLIAEDNLEMAAYIDSLLRPFCGTKIVHNGREALDVVYTWLPDLILTDVMIPERDGLSLCRSVKSNPATMSIPVIMLTALTHREAVLEGWKAGANEYLFKPFHPKELVTRVQSLLQARQNQKLADEKISRLNDNLRQHALDLASANKELEAFSYSVSHDLRAPLRAIDGFSSELAVNCEAVLDERSKDDLHRIRGAVHRMTQLIDDLLELSHLSRSDLKRESVDLSVQVQEVLDKLKGENPARRVNAIVAPHTVAQGDIRLVRIALENLIQNAWKFTLKQPQAKIEFGSIDREGKRAFFVRDNGAGFNMAYAGKLFNPFQRLHDSNEFPGTGIGLALVHRIVNRHGGRIWAEAEENRGATFYFTLS